MEREVGFAGLSHLGLVSSLVSAAKGCRVVAYDPRTSWCQALSRGELPIAEPGLAELLAAHADRIHFTSDAADMARCPLLIVSVDTPTDNEDCGDPSVAARLAEEAFARAAANTTVVIQSQVPPGFTRGLAARVAGQASRRELAVFCQVETLIIGQAVERALHPERIMIGCADPRAPLPAVYLEWLQKFGCPIMQMRYESAEVAKLAVNLFLAASVCTTNTLAELCEAIGADWSDIMPALAADRRIGPYAYLKPGLGLSGGNLERDLTAFQALARRMGTHTAVVEAYRSNSRHRRNWACEALRREAADGELAVGVWGVAYKPDTDSTRNSPALALLEAVGPWPVRVYDPVVRLEPGRWPFALQAPSALEACRDVDALVVMTPWVEFASVDVAAVRSLMRGRLVLDPFGVLDGERCRSVGLRYRRLGVRETGARVVGKPARRRNVSTQSV